MGRLHRIVFTVWHFARRDKVNGAIRELSRNQWLSSSELRVLQQRKLEKLLSHAKSSVPYYSRLLDELEICTDPAISYDDFLRLPPLTKSIILHEKDALVSDGLPANSLKENSTSGSTGEALRFYSDLSTMPYRQAAELRSDSYTGWRLGDRIVRLWGAPIDEKLATNLRGSLHGLVAGQRFLSSFDLSAARMNEYVRMIRAFKPALIVGYPGPLEEFAKHCTDLDVRFPSLLAIVSSAETLWPHQREIIERTFGVSVFDRYGSREVGHIASECNAHDGLHISVDRLLVEVVDAENLPCTPGKTGRILVTDLDNFGMPLIRYEIGDRASMAALNACPCGRAFPKLERIEGRTLEIVRTIDGRQIGGTFWTLLLRSRVGLRQFQVIQDDLYGVKIHFVRDAQFDSGVLDYFIARIKERCGSGFVVEFVEKDVIDLTVSGKKLLIVSRLRDKSERIAPTVV